MKIGLGRSKSRALRPRSCFDLGTGITEVAAALAVGDNFARAGVPAHSRDISGALITAERAAGRLADALGGKARTKARRLAADIAAVRTVLQRGFVEQPPEPIPDAAGAIQRGTAHLRRSAMDIWADVRATCADGAMEKKRARKGR